MGFPRSGTTFLGTHASSYGDKVFFAGEIDKGIENYLEGRNSFCGCGLTYRECPVWSKVLPLINKEDINLQKLFEKIKEVTGAEVIIDSSKTISYIKQYKQLFGEEFFTIHLKRNPKGVALSRMNNRKKRVKKGTHPKLQLAKQYNVMLVYDSLEWSYTNFRMEKIKENEKNIDLTYDLFETQLAEKLPGFFKKIGIKEGSSINSNHIIYGATGRTNYNKQIKVNSSWRDDLTVYQRGAVDIITSPSRFFYKYKFK